MCLIVLPLLSLKSELEPCVGEPIFSCHMKANIQIQQTTLWLSVLINVNNADFKILKKFTLQLFSEEGNVFPMSVKPEGFKRWTLEWNSRCPMTRFVYQPVILSPKAQNTNLNPLKRHEESFWPVKYPHLVVESVKTEECRRFLPVSWCWWLADSFSLSWTSCL